MTIKDCWENLNIPLKEAELLLSFVLDKDIAYIKTHADEHITSEQCDDYLSLIKKRENNEPIAYLISKKYFFDCELKVNKDVLIPRFETETLVEEVLKETKSDNYEVVLDIGTGSGCIAVCLGKHLLKTKILATDISKEALHIATLNSKNNSSSVVFYKSDLLGNRSLQLELKKYKNIIITANLPYLPFNYKKEMQADVLNFEPHLALFTKDDGLFLIKKMLLQIKVFLETSMITKMTIFLEVEPFQILKLKEVVKNLFLNNKIVVIKDLKNDNRFLKIILQ